MSDPDQHAPSPAAPPSEEELESEFVRAAARRLGLLGLTMGGGGILGVILLFIRIEFLGWSSTALLLESPPRLLGLSLFVAVSLGLFGLSRTEYDPRRLLNLGLAYQILGAIMLSMRYARSDDMFLQEHSTALSWLALWIVLFPLFVPARPAKNIVTANLAATVAPVVYFIFALVGGKPIASLQVLASTFAPYYLSAGVAIVPSILLYRLGRTVSATRREVRRLDNMLRTERLAVAGSLAAGVAHEVNNPLAAISSLVQTAQETTDDSGTRELLGDALTHMDRIAKALQGLMRFARPPAGVAQPCNLNQIVERTLGLLRHDKRFRRVTIETVLDPAPGIVMADPDQLQQVLTNVLINASDAVEGRPEPRVVVTTRTDEESVVLEVADNGPGISPDAQHQLFEPFYTTKPPGKGTGLGLAVCRELLREQEGTIVLDSAEGGGARVRITLSI